MLDTVLRIKDGILPPSLMDQLPFTKIKLMNDVIVDINPDTGTVKVEFPDGKGTTKVWADKKNDGAEVPLTKILGLKELEANGQKLQKSLLNTVEEQF